MTKLNALFDKFLQNIEPDQKMVGYAHSAHDPVRTFLEEDEDFGQYVEDTFLYGSYKRHTAVGDIKDVDIVVLTNFDTESEDYTPHKVLRKLKSALARHYGDPKNQEYQRRSIRVNDPLPDNEDVEMTLDIIPAVPTDGNDSPLLVPDRDVKKWILSHPKGHLTNTIELNKYQNSKKRFVPLVKIMKWWWKYQCEIRQPDVERPKPKGFWVEVLTGENFDSSQYDWVDHFIATLESISEKYSDVEEVPELQDPGLAEETVRTSMTLDEFQVFTEAVKESLEQAKKGRSEKDDIESSEIYREIFGEEFPLFDQEESEDKSKEAKKIPLAEWAHAQKPDWSENLHRLFKVHVDAYIYDQGRNKRLSGINSNGRVIQSGFQMKFVAKIRARGEYQVYWQVVNTGKHAEFENDLRGVIFPSNPVSWTKAKNSIVHWEHTKYTGKHWVQCFVVQDNKLVARSKKFYINIKNPDY
jgi:predicted nucleotidyltransferase